MYKNMSVAAVVPALNEEHSIGMVVRDLLALYNADTSAVFDDVVVCDNGSSDATSLRAREAGARVVHEQQPGYGSACLAAIGALQTPDVIVFIDGDHAFDATQAVRLLDAVASGADLVIGSRTLGQPVRGALAPGQELGNRVICALIRLLWGHRVTDLGPYRAIRAGSLARLTMADTRFGWTVEMQVKAIQQGMKTAEVPVDTRVRIGESKISGTLSGAVSACTGILCMIAKLRWQQFRQYRYR